MDAPAVQYAKTDDGAVVAYWTLGSGVPVVLTPARIFSHLRGEWDIPGRRAVFERLAQHCMVVRFDPRGIGMSRMEGAQVAPDKGALDLAGVVDHLGLEKFVLVTQGATNRIGVGMDFALAYPERLSHLILLAAPLTGARRSFYYSSAPLAREHWDQITNLVPRLVFGWETADAAALTRLLQATHTPDSFTDFVLGGPNGYRADLSDIKVPTLVLYASDESEQEEASRRLAAQIPNTRMLGIPGWKGIFLNSLAVDALLAYIASPSKADAGGNLSASFDTGALRTILFTDIEGHTSMMQRLGDTKGREVLREHERLTREALSAHRGAEVKTMGDGFMASFGSAQRALECAVSLQQAFSAHEGEPIRIRVGINAGEPIAEDDDLFGSSVIIAARTAAQAKGGEVLVTDVIRQLVAGKGFVFSDRGETILRGIEEPARLHELEWQL